MTRKIIKRDMKEIIIPEEVLFEKFGISGGSFIDSVSLEEPIEREDGLAKKLIIRYYE